MLTLAAQREFIQVIVKVGRKTKMRFWSRATVRLVAPVALLTVIALVLGRSSLDKTICSWFFDATDGWKWARSEPWDTLYHIGPIPGFVLGGLGIALIIHSVRRRLDARACRVGIFLLLTLAVGPGMIINSVLKPYWGRPRPREITDFGGEHRFILIGDFGPCAGNCSFPCGHASMGFYLLIPGFLFGSERRRWADAWFWTGGLAGLAIGFARIIQGGHYPSDVFASWAIVYACGFYFAALMKVGDAGTPLMIDVQNAFMAWRGPRMSPAAVSLPDSGSRQGEDWREAA